MMRKKCPYCGKICHQDLATGNFACPCGCKFTGDGKTFRQGKPKYTV
jgi:hypothetical protein